MLSTVLLWLLAATVAIQCFYAFWFFIRVFSFPTPVTPVSVRKPVSVIICARNEAANLKENLPKIMAQRYASPAGKPLFEVIVVNDCSDDDTESVLKDLEQQYDELWHVTILPGDERCFQGKKFALSKGVEHSKHELLLLTDADCAPISQFWMELMVGPLNAGKEIAAGYGQHKTEVSLLNAFIRWETLHTFLQYSTYALAGKPYMAVGRNLACTKDILIRAQQTEVWNKLPSGDDDLLVSTMATKSNMTIVCHPQAFTVTEGKRTWGDWFRQKQRHLSTGKYYKGNIKTLLGGYAFSHMLCWSLLFLLFFAVDATPIVMLTAGMLFLVRWFIYTFLWIFAADRLKEKGIAPLLMLFDIGWMIYNFVFSPYIFFKNRKQWK